MVPEGVVQPGTTDPGQPKPDPKDPKVEPTKPSNKPELKQGAWKAKSCAPEGQA